MGYYGSEALLANDEFGDKAHQDGCDHSVHGRAARYFAQRVGSVSCSLGRFRFQRLVVRLMIANG